MRTHAEPLLPPEVAATQVGRVRAGGGQAIAALASLTRGFAWWPAPRAPRQGSILCPHVSLNFSEDQHELLMRILDALTAGAASAGDSGDARPAAPQPERRSALLRTPMEALLNCGLARRHADH